MNEITYLNEHILIGEFGKLCVTTALGSALCSGVSYYLSKKDPTENWIGVARLAFKTHVIAALLVVFTLFAILFFHFFEYHYAWQHSNKEMASKYLFASFWEGQEGSFLLWVFWNAILGWLFLKRAKEWEASSMVIISLVQVFLMSMVLGVHFPIIGIDMDAISPIVIEYIKIGSSPFTLTREHPDMANMPFIKMATYLEKLDGKGLNPLLQNYWMTIHPPTLFLGFASTLIPFAFAVAGVWDRKYKEWLQPALPWTFFSIGILGTGILMGGAWAYEALSFGGFWAWDPVENASLVPWLTMVGAGHLMLINQKKPDSLTATYFMTFISFILVLYSTFLTRSGILGDASVHAFTDLGMMGQLVIYLLFFAILPCFLIVDPKTRRVATMGLLVWGFLNMHYYMGEMDKSLEIDIVGRINLVIILIGMAFVPITITRRIKALGWNTTEEKTTSREFWLFVGSLVLLASALQLSGATSLPVINKLFGTKFAALSIEKYNAWQLPFAIVTSFLIAISQYLRYKETAIDTFFKNIATSFILAIIFTIITIIGFEFIDASHILLLFSGYFAVFSNLDFMLRILGGKVKKAGSSIAHIGVGLVLVGALISNAKKEVISNTSINLGEELSNKENILLTENDRIKMGNYLVSFRGDSTAGINRYFNIDYYTATNKNGGVEKAFTLQNLIQNNPRMGVIAEPSTKHYWDKDVFTHVTSYSDPETSVPSTDGYEVPEPLTMNIGDSMFTNTCKIIFEGFESNIDKKKYNINDSDWVVGARLCILDINQVKYYTTPICVIKNNIIPIETLVPELGLKIAFVTIDPTKKEIGLEVSVKKGMKKDFVVLKAIVFPAINLLWIGCFLLAIGTGLAVWQRIKVGIPKREVSK